jgi:hypothetical protein
VFLLLLLSGCSSYTPSNLDDACRILGDNHKWYKQALKASNEWKTPIATQLAFIHQESRFKGNAKPPRTKILWVIPGPRKSDAYGYGQVKKDTWRWYQKSTGHYGADRDDFGDVVQFIGWYNKESQRRLGVGLGDPYHQYLAYHEGHGGFERKTFNKKPWLKPVAQKVAKRAYQYQQQIKDCQKELGQSRFWFF